MLIEKKTVTVCKQNTEANFLSLYWFWKRTLIKINFATKTKFNNATSISTKICDDTEKIQNVPPTGECHSRSCHPVLSEAFIECWSFFNCFKTYPRVYIAIIVNKERYDILCSQ